jgi:23S rRNA pseudouridine1911/1915/1917 synthase
MINKPYEVFVETKDFLVVIKKAGVPSCIGATSGSCYELVATDFPEVAQVIGKKQEDGGLIHRLDTDTEGLLVFAKNQNSYDSIMEEQNSNKFIKTYTAYCSLEKSTIQEKSINLSPRVLESYFRPFGEKGATVKPIFSLERETKANKKKCGKKLYTTKIVSIESFLENKTTKLLKIKCQITQGFRHQVRSHLGSQNLPVFGDKLYNPLHPEADTMLFFASGLSFFNENYTISEDSLDEVAKRTFLASATK